MGFHSQDCQRCGHPLLSYHAINAINEWMTDVVAIAPDGTVIMGTYDGYGTIVDAKEREHERAVGGDYEWNNATGEYDRTGVPTVFHTACWQLAGEPREFLGASRDSADQGWFFGDQHDMPEPERHTNIVRIPLSEINKCPDARMDVMHFRDDGTCLHQAPPTYATE